MGVVTVTWWLQDVLSKYQAPPSWFLEHTQICIIQKTHRHLNSCCKKPANDSYAWNAQCRVAVAWTNLVVSSLPVWLKDQMQLRLRHHLNSVSSLRDRDKAWCLQPQNVSWTCQDTTHGTTEIEKDAVQEFRRLCFDKALLLVLQ